MTVHVFHVNKNGASEGGYPGDGQYHMVNFTHIREDSGSQWDASYCRWEPPAGSVDLQWQIWLTAGAALKGTNAIFVAKVIKNATVTGGVPSGGTDLIGAIGVQDDIPGVATMKASVSDIACEGDHYQLFLYASAQPGQTVTVDGNVAHTYFSGKSFG